MSSAILVSSVRSAAMVKGAYFILTPPSSESYQCPHRRSKLPILGHRPSIANTCFQAFELNFLSDFTKYTILPAVVSAIVIYPLLVLAFKTTRITHTLDKTAQSEFIPRSFIKPDVDPKSALVDPQGAVFHSVLMLVTLGVLVGSSFIGGVHVWMVTAPGAIVGLTRDIIYDLSKRRKSSKNLSNGNGRPSSPSSAKDGPHKVSSSSNRITLQSLWRKASKILPSTCGTVSRLPWPLLPFAVGMFILTRSLDHLGYIPIFADWTAKACTDPVKTVFFVGGITALGLCPLCGTVGGLPLIASIPIIIIDPSLLVEHWSYDLGCGSAHKCQLPTSASRRSQSKNHQSCHVLR